MMLDGLRDIFLKSLKFVPNEYKYSLVEQWNKECDNVWKYKESIKREIYLDVKEK